MNLVIYTAITSGYDALTHAPNISAMAANVGVVAFLETTQKAHGWTVRMIGPTSNPLLTARMYKILSHRWFPDAEVTIWMDGAIQMLTEPQNLLAWIESHDVAGLTHPSRDCAYQEGTRCIVKGKAAGPVISRQLSAYRASGFPEGAGLIETGVLIRRHTDAVKELNELWWEHIIRYSKRDQVSLPYVSWKLGVDINRIPGSLVKHPWFKHHGHGGRNG